MECREKGAPWDVTPDQVHDVTRKVKSLLPGFLREEEGAAAGGGGGAVDEGPGGSGGGGGGGGGQGQGQGQGGEARFWEVGLPAFIERCLSCSINDIQALPYINRLFMVRISKQASKQKNQKPADWPGLAKLQHGRHFFLSPHILLLYGWPTVGNLFWRIQPSLRLPISLSSHGVAS